MSEGALLCVAAAVAGAVSDASGVVIRDLPLTPERVWRALRDAEREHPSGQPPGEEQT
jgi:CO/xanthine dehydrogenase Mo-binding subunit